MKKLSVIFALLLSLPAFAGDDSEALKQVAELQQQWASIKYGVETDKQEAPLKALSEQADAAVARHHKSPELLIWRGIILSTYAGAKGGLGALTLVGQARESLEQALVLNPNALSGSAYTSLGALYYQVPGWPISFGSNSKARELLTKALTINPDGIDSNYFYADYLISENDYDGAREALNRALKAPGREGRELADRGRREEIKQLLQRIEGKHSS
ncbi:tetratricopeptide repeat protein [Aestuariirhabdus litorea]|uniref:Uncharacterized protein n=1 Tax=Aestuariirhabdus litorea TaxID=2528527 RepID=A0A3P3VQT6_9GAMM|nr:tetratricopeptide repeat protein [Aestuariirhabdus litorea]RRJ84026.1 hypothetical protein D0544_02590 [Aestuariirhabdus litorea]RWW97246.1 tetratricopeptide repeat protein [Endozoicomonadaceae bacterium GTF-13]